MLSIADRLEREGFKVKIVNLAEKMLLDERFELERYIKDIDAKVYGIDLHWCVHTHGAIEVAHLCKRLHPEAYIIIGGLTATRFHEEIISSCRFVDAVIRGEAEESTVELVKEVMCGRSPLNVQGITFRDVSGRPKINQDRVPLNSIDYYEFTRIELLEPALEAINFRVGSQRLKMWNVPVCRGCIFNCVTCGGSAYAYRKLFNREAPAFRSVNKILEDFQNLDDKGFNSIFLFQDVRMAGRHYWKELFKALNSQRWSNLEHVTMELFTPADEEFIRFLTRFRPVDKVALTISPESGDNIVRILQGRNYSNEELIRNLKICLKFEVPISVFFMTTLAYETAETLNKTYKLWNALLHLGQRQRLINVELGPMILLDPGSLAFENPEKHGYHLKFQNLEEHKRAMATPFWVDWINYETFFFKKEELPNIILQSLEKLIKLKAEYNLIGSRSAKEELLDTAFEKLLLGERKEIIDLKNKREKHRKLKELFEISRDPLLRHSYILTRESNIIY
jgi:B12-binding domain/radical SAM domain protein